MKYLYWLLGITYMAMAITIAMGQKPSTFFSVSTCAFTALFFISTAIKTR